MCAAVARRIARVSRTVSDLGRAVAFHTDALDFRVVDESNHRDRSWGQLMGVPELHSHSFTLRLGEDELELVAFDPPGAPCPRPNDTGHICRQRIAIAVSDMDAAFNRLCGYSFTAITEAGPQILPALYGGRRAYKFRDPDGHALELIEFVDAGSEKTWRRQAGLFLGIDHTAIDVADVKRSIDFYTRILGMTMTSSPHMPGAAREYVEPEHQKLASVIDVHCACCTHPYLELISYPLPADNGSALSAHVNDICADRMIVEVDDLPSLVDALRAAHIDVVSLGPSPTGAHAAVIARDPSGHLLQLCA